MWTAGLAGPGKVTLLGDGEIELENLEPEGEAFTKSCRSLSRSKFKSDL